MLVAESHQLRNTALFIQWILFCQLKIETQAVNTNKQTETRGRLIAVNCCIFIQVTVPTGKFNSQSKAAALNAEDNGNPGLQQQLESKAKALLLGWRHSGRSAGSHGPGAAGTSRSFQPCPTSGSSTTVAAVSETTHHQIYFVLELWSFCTAQHNKWKHVWHWPVFTLLLPPFAVSCDIVLFCDIVNVLVRHKTGMTSEHLLLSLFRYCKCM